MNRNFRTLRAATLAAVLLSLAANPAVAESVGDLFTAYPSSARAEGMGGAFAAVAEGALGLFANPAGLGFCETPELSSTRRNLELDRTIESTAVRFEVWPGAQTALGYRRHAIDGLESRDDTGILTGTFGAREEIVTAGQGMSLGENAAFGFALHGTRDKMGTSGASGEGLDAGLLLRGQDMSIGLVGRHLAQRKRWYGTATNPTERMAPVFIAGTSFRHGRHLLAVDVEADQNAGERCYRGGVESRLTDKVTFRAGLNDGHAAWGVGYASQGYRIDCGFTNGALGDTGIVTATFFDPLERLLHRERKMPDVPAPVTPPVADVALALPPALDLAAAPVPDSTPAPVPDLAPVIPEHTLLHIAKDFSAGRRLFLAGNYAGAVEPLTATVEADPRRADAACLLGISLLKSGQPEMARDILRTAIAIDPANPYAKYADVYLR